MSPVRITVCFGGPGRGLARCQLDHLARGGNAYQQLVSGCPGLEPGAGHTRPHLSGRSRRDHERPGLVERRGTVRGRNHERNLHEPGDESPRGRSPLARPLRARPPRSTHREHQPETDQGRISCGPDAERASPSRSTTPHHTPILPNCAAPDSSVNGGNTSKRPNGYPTAGARPLPKLSRRAFDNAGLKGVFHA